MGVTQGGEATVRFRIRDGQKVRQMMKEAGMSQAWCAGSAGVSSPLVSQLLAGKTTTPTTAYRLALVLGQEVDVLFAAVVRMPKMHTAGVRVHTVEGSNQ